MEEFGMLEDSALKMPDKERRQTLIQVGSSNGVLDYRNRKDYNRILTIMFEYIQSNSIFKQEDVHKYSNENFAEQSYYDRFKPQNMEKEHSSMQLNTSHQSLQELKNDKSHCSARDEDENEDEIQIWRRRSWKAASKRTQRQVSKQVYSASKV
ncbi:MAG: hypothetical protein EZS28_051548 [Streblomastix strix]|uniref:Uncharacterized protein n=1 Tax=Streblomastix strix TaxID=222440 RepID=A0A5J4T6D0_9EUKA|nr:MAG: hypothetical protein EZS28_051548 [Streblomastix strix]